MPFYVLPLCSFWAIYLSISHKSSLQYSIIINFIVNPHTACIVDGKEWRILKILVGRSLLYNTLFYLLSNTPPPSNYLQNPYHLHCHSIISNISPVTASLLNHKYDGGKVSLWHFCVTSQKPILLLTICQHYYKTSGFLQAAGWTWTVGHHQ